MSQCSSKYKGVDFNDRSKYDSYNAKNPDFGYITECGEDCKSGYTEIDTFRAKNKINGINYPLCGWAWEWRKVCRKNRRWLPSNSSTRKRKCCTGEYSGINSCHPDYCPGSRECVNVMKKYCDNSTNFFKSECQEFLTGLQGSSNKGIINTLGNKYCPGVKNSSNSSKKLICACFNADGTNNPAIKENPILRGAAISLDKDCGNSKALKPADHRCDINSVVCKNESNRLALIESDVGLKASIENECGINISGGNGGSTTTNTGSSGSGSGGSSTESGGSSEGGSSTLYWALGIGGGIFFLIILALVIFLIL